MLRPLSAVCAFALVLSAAAEEPAFRDGLVIPAAGRGGRDPLPVDPVAALIAEGTFKTPKAGDAVTAPGGQSRTWKALAPEKDGSYQVGGGGYACFVVPSDRARVMVLEASGHGAAYVNGEPRPGDMYSHGYVHLPVRLNAGDNTFLFHVARGPLKAKLVEPKGELAFNPNDATLPDLVAGDKLDSWGAMPLLNATDAWQKGLTIETTLPGADPVRAAVPPLPPLSSSKVPFRIAGAAKDPAEKVPLTVRLLRDDKVVATIEVSVRARKPGDNHKRTFLSDIDGSVQYFALVPASAGDPSPGLILTLHGAGVEGLGQAACFAPKPWAHVIAATNRRPYGFDWEDWGRLDALEVLAQAEKQLHPDPAKRWLTGHSMGGHGTWHLGVTYPDQWGAIGPSAGWDSLMNYGGRMRPENSDPVRELFGRLILPSDTHALLKNLTPLGVYILHGDKDDNVPVTFARTMRKLLDGFHKDVAYHEQPGAGHWWGNDCVDWGPMREFFQKHPRPASADVKHVAFATASPSVSADCFWVTIAQQQKSYKLSTVDLTRDADKRTFAGTTENVARLRLDVSALPADKPLTVDLDGTKLEAPWPAGGKLWLDRTSTGWAVAAAPAGTQKGPQRSGPFREAFRNHVVFVVGTRGSAEENAWALAKARYDAESFWYRGNGFVPVVLDSDFDPAKEPDRNVVLYGNADTNAAWKPLLDESPVQVRKGAVAVGKREEKGDGLGMVLVRPRPGSDRALVGAVTGTGVVGMRRTDRLPYFISGVGYPDAVLFGPSGVRMAGFFGNDWAVESGEFAWRE